MKSLFLLTISVLFLNCSSSKSITDKTPATTALLAPTQMDFWLTKGDQSVKLQKQLAISPFGTKPKTFPTIAVDESKTFQTIDGFGYTLTGGSVQVINQLNAPKRKELLQELFGSGKNAISVSYLRISIGASDLDAMPFTYIDLPIGQTDMNLEKFSLAPNKNDVIPMLKEILAINPNIKIIATPWSPPVWMKDKNSSIGGSLQPKYYEVYAQYFVKYIQQMKAEGITIDAITPQNEPLHPGNNPSLLMLATQQADFIKNHLGPAFQNANLKTKIITYDHNCNKPEYPLAILNDAEAYPYVDGSAFHLYEGDISALSTVHDAFPNKNVYFTEQYTSNTGSFDGDLKWHLRNVIIGSMRNWSKTALEWNLANNASFGPNTPGGCTTCKGALTIENSQNFTRNVAYYIIAHASKFVPAGSVRIASNLSGNLQNVAFKTPEGKKVLIVENDGDTAETFNIKYNEKWVTTSLEAGSVATYIW
ncbi:MAG: glycoside hydrolase family 30 beta sandwich domain-containing protein [Flavobacterium sp.]|uniref:glycoside hydrolase family 30 protein n=1 Tax=Flavobacterium sp. TaxID=239 RepID=UPI002632B895|nr:glycoside hydrolase family 30 beta sandwich domain-containing protein [Flavobacterium sp.]MDD5151262.1 glycoside hydrolase family 30 beta sandwich domain-containing protein [Flavobacterium sp.]